ncbi:hypothetical protein VFPBJ_00512 [Purpureocillium lilacinum]|uniref:Uncharacterized protein n=1 Tax=Purpureocillium lilacinum TaxID=33203 RepID=A0A179H971_PURLI|nr:hypothetical protein VFPBJ_00512 [Purpureocillium lilacinum]
MPPLFVPLWLSALPSPSPVLSGLERPRRKDKREARCAAPHKPLSLSVAARQAGWVAPDPGGTGRLPGSLPRVFCEVRGACGATELRRWLRGIDVSS